jgi:hypothetical protein
MPPNIRVLYKIDVRDDKTGKIVKHGRWKKSKSFVIAFLQIVQAQAFDEAPTIKDVGGTNRNQGGLNTNFTFNAPSGNSTYGIVVGTGVTPQTNTDNKLGTQIATGSGSGQLNYGAESEVAAQVVGPNVDYTNSRTFQNLSGSTITITEIGLIANFASFLFLVIHDLATQAVNALQTATVTYTMRTTA